MLMQMTTFKMLSPIEMAGHPQLERILRVVKSINQTKSIITNSLAVSAPMLIYMVLQN